MYQVVSLLSIAINFYCLMIFVWALLSWFQNVKAKVVRDIYKALDVVVLPYVKLFRKIIPPMGGIDLSAFVAMVVLQLVGRLLIGFLF